MIKFKFDRKYLYTTLVTHERLKVNIKQKLKWRLRL